MSKDNNTFANSTKYLHQQKQEQINLGNDTTQLPKPKSLVEVVKGFFCFVAKDPYEKKLSDVINIEINKFDNDLVAGKPKVEALESFLENLYTQVKNVITAIENEHINIEIVGEDKSKVLESGLWLYNAKARYSECFNNIKLVSQKCIFVPKVAPLNLVNDNSANIVTVSKDNEEAKIEDVKNLGAHPEYSDC